MAPVLVLLLVDARLLLGSNDGVAVALLLLLIDASLLVTTDELAGTDDSRDDDGICLDESVFEAVYVAEDEDEGVVVDEDEGVGVDEDEGVGVGVSGLYVVCAEVVAGTTFDVVTGG